MDDLPLHPMDDSLRIIQYLYGEEVDDPDFARRVADDEDLRREFDRLQETKDALDRRSSPSPDSSVVDQVVDRAADAAPSTPSPTRASDRAPRSPTRNWTRRLQNAGAGLALVLAVGLGWWYMPKTDAPPESSAQQTESATAASESGQDAEELPEWDDRDEVVRLHRRIEQLQTQSRSDAWTGNPQPATQTRP
jgi:hypothetical protein